MLIGWCWSMTFKFDFFRFCLGVWREGKRSLWRVENTGKNGKKIIFKKNKLENDKSMSMILIVTLLVLLIIS